MTDLIEQAQLETFASYADRHNIFDLFQSLLTQLVVLKPVEPFQFMIDFVQKPITPSVVVLGPPSSGHREIVEGIARNLDAVYINSGNILKTAMEKQTTVGLQAKAYIERGHLVPDEIIISMITSRLQEFDVQERGFVLEGFPRTKEQAAALVKRGIIPRHFILFDFPDSIIINRAVGLRHDPVTGRTYHLKFDPPPKNATIESRLTRRPTDTGPAVRARLALYRKNIDSAVACLKSQVRRFYYPDGIYGNKETIDKDVYSFLSSGSITKGPRSFKILIQGLPGSGKTSVAQFLAKKYKHVHVSPRKVILEEMALGSHYGTQLAPYVNNTDAAPESFVIELIASRIKKKDCVENGWVLEGFPNTKSQAQALAEKGVVPNRFFWLDTNWETCLTRLSKRRYDPVTGRVANIVAPQKDISSKVDLNTWSARAEDREEIILERMENLRNLKSELESFYEFRTTTESKGVMQIIEADGVGEPLAGGEQPTLEQVFDLVDGNLLRPIPIQITHN